MGKLPLISLRNFLGDRVVERGRGNLVVRPATVDELCRAVEMLADAGCTMRAAAADNRPTTVNAVIALDGLDRVVEINEADRFVTVEAGCTWRALHLALSSHRLRTPFFGPFGDGSETIGASASTNAHFFGSGLHGTMNDTVLGLDVVLVDGSLVETGAAAAEGRTSFFRHFGPDLTGLFLGDSGAFGIKARVTLPVMPLPGAEDFVSFAFERFEDIAAAHAVLAREGLAAEHWGLDPDRNEFLAARGHRSLDGVTFSRNGTIPLRGDRARATVPPRLIDGHRIVQRGGWSFHAVTEGVDARDAEGKVAQIRKLLLPTAMREIPPAIPAALRARPFDMEDLRATRHVAHHVAAGLFPLSRATEMAAVTDEYFIRHQEAMTRDDIGLSIVTSAAGSAFSIEATVSWPPAKAGVQDAAETLVRDLSLLWGAFGAAEHGAGRDQGYSNALSSAALALSRSVKSALDPRNLMNPGALGFGTTPRKPSALKFAEFPQHLETGAGTPGWTS
jgi:FAD/FMN-containing dehydrogenase